MEKKSQPSILSAEAKPEERLPKSEEKIRPQSLADYIGQKELKEVLHIAIEAAKSRQEPLDHLLLYGPPGLGKNDDFIDYGLGDGGEL